MRQRKPSKREARKKPREVEPEKPDGLPEVTGPVPAWAREMWKRLK